MVRRTMHPLPSQGPRPTRTLYDLLALYERNVIIAAIAKNGFSRKRAAASLGLRPNHLWRRMRALGINFAELPRTTPGRPRKKFS